MALAGLLLCSLFSGASQARDLVRICAHEWEPYAYADADGAAVRGITVRLVTTAMSRLDRDVRFQLAPSNRCLQQLLHGTADMVLFANPGDYRQLPHSSVSTESWMLTMWVQQESSLTRYTGLSLFQGFSAGLVLGYEYPAPIRGFSAWQPVLNPDPLTNLRQLANGRLGVVPEDYVAARRLVQRWQLQIRPLLPAVVSAPQFAVFSERYRKVVPAYDAQLKKMLKEGLFDAACRAETGKSCAELHGQAALGR